MPRPLLLPARRPSEPSQRDLARRALIEPERGHTWRRTGLAVLAVSVLGVGTAGSVVVTGNAERPISETSGATTAASTLEVSIAKGVQQPEAFVRQGRTAAQAADRPTRDSARPALLAGRTPATDALRARATALSAQAHAAKKRAHTLAKKQAEERAAERARRKALVGDGRPVLPVAGGRTAAGFGATGAWARYHTGIDYSAGTGTAVRAPRAGVVSSAGGGSASGWAGTYVTVRHSDGTSSLYAHLSSSEVSDGQRVNAGQTIGRVGQTGRAFGPHLHFEIYPAGVEPGDVYQAVDPNPWLNELGL